MIISNAIKLPGVKVDRNRFLAESFANEGISVQAIIDNGPVSAGVPQAHIERAAEKLIWSRTVQSSLASFVAGLPGSIAMAATVPADIVQFFGMALRLAQELSYLYGAPDLWIDGCLDDERVKNQLILYCGVMLNVSLAASGVRALSTQIAKTTLKKLPQKALTKTFWYPIIKQIGKAIGVKITKTTVAQGVSKAVPIVGGVISGGLNFASLLPMAKRLNAALDQSCFDYSEAEMNADIEILENINTETAQTDKFSQFASAAANSVQDGWKRASSNASSLLNKIAGKSPKAEPQSAAASYDEKIAVLRNLKQLVDEGILSQEEFDAKKKELLDL